MATNEDIVLKKLALFIIVFGLTSLSSPVFACHEDIVPSGYSHSHAFNGYQEVVVLHREVSPAAEIVGTILGLGAAVAIIGNGFRDDNYMSRHGHSRYGYSHGGRYRHRYDNSYELRHHRQDSRYGYEHGGRYR